MNNSRRKRIADLCKQLEELKDQITNDLGSIKDDIETLQTEEQEAFENLPEGLQQTDKGQAMEQAADGLVDAAGQAEEIATTFTNDVDELLTALGSASA